MRFYIPIIFALLMVSTSFVGVSYNLEKSLSESFDGNIFYVGGSGEGNYSKIQDAIDNASDGDTVFVYNGTYVECLIVNKSLYIIGQDRNTTVIDGNYYRNVVNITADRVTINGFTIQKSGDKPDDGIIIYSNNNSIINNNISFNIGNGISLLYSNDNIIKSNIIASNWEVGLKGRSSCDNYIINNIIHSHDSSDAISFSRSCNNNIINNNTMSSNDLGIEFYFHCNNNTIIGNNITSSVGTGIKLRTSCCNNTIIANNVVQNYNAIGITDSSNNNVIAGNNFSNNWYKGIGLYNSKNNIILDNIIINTGHDSGISVSNSIYTTIKRNIISNNGRQGIDIESSKQLNIIEDNIISEYSDGIRVTTCSNSIIFNNTILNNIYGIFLDRSSKNKIRDNSFLNSGLFIEDSYLNNVENNTLNDKPLIYLENKSYEIIDYDVGQVIIVNCNNITVENQNLCNASVGIGLLGANNCKIRNNSCMYNFEGIYLKKSNGNNISCNNIAMNQMFGIDLSESSENIITDNNISNSDYGINFWSTCNANVITCNNINSNNYGIFTLGYKKSSGNTISCNNINMNKKDGIILYDLTGTNIKENNITLNKGYGIRLMFISDNTIQGNNISYNKGGINIWDSSINLIKNNLISKNDYGVSLGLSSSNNNITANHLFSNNDYGIIILDSSDNNIIYHNNFINNSQNANDECENTWDDGEYGNYWSDYKEQYPDAKKKRWKGIWNTPYEIEGGDNKDNFPLINQYPKSVIKSKSIDKPWNYNFPLLSWLLDRFPLLQRLLEWINII